MRHPHVVLTALFLVLLAAPAIAQQQAGDSEFQLQGSLTLVTSGDAESSGGANLIYGRFFTERQEAGLQLSGRFEEDGDLGGLVGPFYRYNFSTGNVVPYAGTAAGATFGDAGDSVALALEGGVRMFLNRNTAFSVGANTVYSVDEQEFRDAIDIVFGFSYLWGN